jgi:hypothetical protein
MKKEKNFQLNRSDTQLRQKQYVLAWKECFLFFVKVLLISMKIKLCFFFRIQKQKMKLKIRSGINNIWLFKWELSLLMSGHQ